MRHPASDIQHSKDRIRHSASGIRKLSRASSAAFWEGEEQTPRYRMPAEWEPHAATWIAWPHNKSDWPGKFEPIPFVYAEVVRHLSHSERVDIIAHDAKVETAAQRVLKLAHVPTDNVRFHRWPTNRVWTRDSGPIFVRDIQGQTTVLNFKFNAWAKYEDWQHDDELPHRIARTLKVPELKPELRLSSTPSKSVPSSIKNQKSKIKNARMVLEGGSIDVNGRGTMLTTSECLLDCDVQPRNPGASRADVERVFGDYLGITKTIWLERGIVGDDTHGHVDDIARFVAPDTVAAVVEHGKSDENYAILQNNLETLRTATAHDGKRLRVIELPMPAPVIYRGQRLPASYANFYITNHAVLVPVFNDSNDRVALNTLADLFPDRRIVPIYCGDFIWGLGAIHCATQQQPA
jgi:agmatine deiminase